MVYNLVEILFDLFLFIESIIDYFSRNINVKTSFDIRDLYLTQIYFFKDSVPNTLGIGDFIKNYPEFYKLTLNNLLLIICEYKLDLLEENERIVIFEYFFQINKLFINNNLQFYTKDIILTKLTDKDSFGIIDLISLLFLNKISKSIILSLLIYELFIYILKNYILNSTNLFIYKIFNEYTNNIINKNTIKNLLILLISNFLFVSISYIFDLVIIKTIFSVFLFFFLNIVMSIFLFISFKTRILVIIRGFYNNFKISTSSFYDLMGIFIFFSRFMLQSVRIISCMIFIYTLNELNINIINFFNYYEYNIFYNSGAVREDFFLFINITKSVIEYLDIIISYSTNNIVFVSINIWLISFLLTYVKKRSYYFFLKRNL